MQYSVLIQYDSIDKIFVASVPELKGCMAHGKTREDAMHEIQIAMQLLLRQTFMYASSCSSFDNFWLWEALYTYCLKSMFLGIKHILVE